MTTETKATHPAREAVAVGQTRKSAQETYTIYAIVGQRAVVCRQGQVDLVNGYVHKGDDGCCWESVSALEDCEVISPAPQSEPCAPEGYKPCKRKCGRWSRNTFNKNSDTTCYQCCGSQNGGKNEAYPDWTPPLESKPAETCPIVERVHDPRCVLDRDHKSPVCKWPGMNAKPPAQEAPKVPVCGSCVKPHPTVLGRVRKGGRMLLCEPCMLAAEKDQSVLMMFESSGTPYAGPERLAKPRLSFAPFDDSCLEDA